LVAPQISTDKNDKHSCIAASHISSSFNKSLLFEFYSRSRRGKQFRPSRIGQQAHAASEQSRERRYQTQTPIWRMHFVQNDNGADEQESGEEGAELRYEGANGSVRSVGDAGFGALAILRWLS
jgi:hypothetical protein